MLLSATLRYRLGVNDFGMSLILTYALVPDSLGGIMKAAVSAVLICACALAGCSTLSGLAETQSTVSKFDQGVRAVSTSEMNFLHQVQAAECTRDFYKQAFSFATAQQNPETHQYPQVTLNLAPTCIPKELTNEELQLRQKLMDAITLYADSLQALTNGANDSGLSSKSSTLAKNIQALASQQQFTAITANDTAGLNAAVTSVAEFIIDHHEYTNIRDAAAALQQPLATIVSTLKSENVNDAEGLASNLGTVTNDFRTAVLSSRDQRGPASFLDITQAHTALNSILIPPPNVAQLNDALDAVVAANQALTSAKDAGTRPEITALISRGQQAISIFNSSK